MKPHVWQRLTYQHTALHIARVGHSGAWWVCSGIEDEGVLLPDLQHYDIELTPDEIKTLYRLMMDHEGEAQCPPA